MSLEFELKSLLQPPNDERIDRKISISRCLLAIAFVLSAFGGCRCPWTCTNTELAESSRWSQSGIESFHDGNHDQAEKLLSQAVESRPDDPILREHLASTYLQQGKQSEAISQLMQAAEMSGNDASIYVKIGQLYLNNNQWIPADQFAKKAIQANRQLPEAWVLLAETKLAKGQLSQALSDYQRALSLKNDYPEIQLKVAEVHRLLGRPLRAFSTVEQMLSQLPVSRQPENALLLSGRLLIEMRQPAQAVEKLRLATARTNASPESFIQLANAQLSLGRKIDARSTLVQASQRHPNVPEIASILNDLDSGDERIAALDISSDEVIR